MYREINRKRIILENRKPYSHEARDKIKLLDQADFISSLMMLKGEAFDTDVIEEMLEGIVYPDISLETYVRMEAYRSLLAEMVSMSEMKLSISKSVMLSLHGSLTEDEPALRADDVKGAYGFTATPAAKIEESLAVLFNFITRDGAEYEIANPLETPKLRTNPSDFVLRASYFIGYFLKIYPFAEENVETAIVLMEYYLMCKGYPVFRLQCDKNELADAIIDYFRGGEPDMLSEIISRSLYAKMERLIKITAGE